MDKYKFDEVEGYIVYPIEYLMNEELTDNDLINLIDNKSLTYSLIISMFKFAGVKKSKKDIIHIIRTKDKWMNDYIWNTNELNVFEDKLAKVYKNIYYLNDNIAKSKAQWFITVYGFRIKGNNIDL